MTGMKLSPDQRVFCSYAYTGEDAERVERCMKGVVEAFSSAGINAYCNLYDPEVANFTVAKQYIDRALNVINSMDILFVVMTSERRSEGMLIEVGAAYNAGKPLILARHISANGKTYLDTLATQTFEWKTEADLIAGIRSLV